MNRWVALLSAVSILPLVRLNAETIEPDVNPVIQQAEFWLWFSQYGDSNGSVFDPEDLDQLMQRQDAAVQEGSTEDVTTMNDETEKADQGRDSSSFQVGEEEL